MEGGGYFAEGYWVAIMEIYCESPRRLCAVNANQGTARWSDDNANVGQYSESDFSFKVRSK